MTEQVVMILKLRWLWLWEYVVKDKYLPLKPQKKVRIRIRHIDSNTAAEMTHIYVLKPFSAAPAKKQKQNT